MSAPDPRFELQALCDRGGLELNISGFGMGSSVVVAIPGLLSAIGKGEDRVISERQGATEILQKIRRIQAAANRYDQEHPDGHQD